MKRLVAVVIMFVAAVALCVVGVKYAKERTESNLENMLTTTGVVENTTEIEETTEVEKTIDFDFRPETTERYENPELYRQVGVLASKLPFSFGFPNEVGRVCMYVPTEDRGDSDVWDNAYIEVEHHRGSEDVIIKLDKADGIITGNIVPKEEMEISNLTFIYLDGKYSQDYIMDRDGDMIIFKDFPADVEEIHISNRSVNPIYEGEISGENVYVNDIIIKIVD